VQENSTSGLKGVNLYKRTGKYRATIKVQRVPIHLGYFATAQEAAIAYDLAAAAYFGPYAATNKSLGLISY
jgi:hypothetical protein